ncbi:hypothetical protein F1847_08150 [Thermodesulfobacterium sp. TA1]|uniref:hypothetical protein n=1 Tax=Thermodesulfobacterium sp. TA1 TaxID=2234087 RepID=UPI0012320C71|nr:hypothetical protein [Thermodesulfobacterium sp. TA1]QER42714.1 hypothetical protein F1847_08150 [Thermodesulfobacterium sp. TA1]
MKDYKPILQKLLNNQCSPKDFELLKKDFKKLLKRAFKTHFTSYIEKVFAKYYGPDYLEALSQELFVKIVYQKDTLLSLNFIHENYLFAMVVNLIYYHLSSGFRVLEKEVNFEDLFSQKDQEEKELKLEESIPQVFINYLEDQTLLHLSFSLKQSLTKKELETLCWYILKNIYKHKNQTSEKRDAFYKRWERLKPKLKEILVRELLEDTNTYKFFEVIKSEICEKLDLLKSKK